MQLSAKGHCPRPVTPPLYPPTIPQLPPASTTHRDGEICKNLADREGKTRDEESALSSIQLTKPKNHTSCPNGPRQSQLTKHQLQLTKPVGEKIPGFSRYTQNPYLNTRGTLHRSVLLGYKENQQKVQWTGKATSRHTSNTKHKHGYKRDCAARATSVLGRIMYGEQSLVRNAGANRSWCGRVSVEA